MLFAIFIAMLLTMLLTMLLAILLAMLTMFLTMYTITTKVPITLSKIYGHFKYLYYSANYIRTTPFSCTVTFVAIHTPNVTNSN